MIKGFLQLGLIAMLTACGGDESSSSDDKTNSSLSEERTGDPSYQNQLRLALGSNYSGSLGTPDLDIEDWFVVSVPANTTITVEWETTANVSNFDAYLRNESNDSYKIMNPVSASNVRSISWHIEKAQDIRIIIHSFTGVGTYNLNITSGSKENTTGIVPEAMHGIWKLFIVDNEETGTAEANDELYMLISNSGASFFDYQGDAFNMGENCYEYSEGFALVPISNDAYTDSDSRTKSILLDNHNIIESGLTTPESGDPKPYYREWAKSERTVSDFTPSC